MKSCYFKKILTHCYPYTAAYMQNCGGTFDMTLGNTCSHILVHKTVLFSSSSYLLKGTYSIGPKSRPESASPCNKNLVYLFVLDVLWVIKLLMHLHRVTASFPPAAFEQSFMPPSGEGFGAHFIRDTMYTK